MYQSFVRTIRRRLARVGSRFETLENRTLLASVPAGFAYADHVTGLPESTSMTFAPDGRIFYTEKGGAVRVIKNGVKVSTPVVQVSVDGYFERGLQCITLDPQFATNGIFYLYYTKRPATNANTAPNDAKNRISRFQLNLSGNKDVVNPDVPEAVVLDDIPSDSGYHNGGAMVFDNSTAVPASQRLMYVGVGEVGLPKFDQATDRAQDLSTLAGKVLRINPRAGAQLIPSDNPFVGQSGKRAEIYSYGLRNPFTMAVKPGTNLVYANDVGSFKAEEVNQIKSGANYGYPLKEGFTTQAGIENPVHAYTHESTGHPNGQAAITGGAFYTASEFPEQFQGKYFFSDYINKFIAYFDPANPPARGADAPRFATDTGAILDLDVGSDGNLYGLTHSVNSTARIVKICYAGDANRNPEAVASADKTSGALPLTVNFSGDGTADPDGDTLTYNWTFGDGASARGKNVSHAYTDKGVYSAKLTVTDGEGGSDESEIITIDAGNQAPNVTISLPAVGTLYSGGDTINFAGAASDPDDGDLPASRFDWRVTLFHDTHTHPFLDDSIDGITSGSFTVPVDVETAPNQFYRIELTVTDSNGLAATAHVDVLPRTATFTLDSNIDGITLNLDGQPQDTPASILGVAGTRRRLDAPDTQTVGGITYEFVEWSDGGARFHDISSPATDTTYTATYRAFTGDNAAIRGVVFNDLDGDGLAQPGEPPLAGWVVYLDQDVDGQHDEGEPAVETNGEGRFALERLAAGTYRVRVAVPGGWATVHPVDGSYLIELADGQAADGNGFANRQIGEPPPAAQTAAISGTVFADANRDGVRQDGEPPLAGWLVYLDQNTNGARDDGEHTIGTQGDGSYAFDGLAAGSYQVRTVAPAGWAVTGPADGRHAVVLAEGQRADGQTFGFDLVTTTPPPVGGPPPGPGVIAGRVFDDLDLDGIDGAGEPGVRRVKVYLDSDNDGRRDKREPRAVTDAAGAFAFTGLPPGNYVMRHLRLRGFRHTAPGAGDARGGGVAAVDLTTSAGATVEFGMTRKSVLQGTVFPGASAAPAAPLLAGTTVFLDLNRDGAPSPGEPTTLTDDAGQYTFIVDRGGHRVAAVMPGGGIVVSKAKVGPGRIVTRDIGKP